MKQCAGFASVLFEFYFTCKRCLKVHPPRQNDRNVCQSM